MATYYNENDAEKAAVIRELIKANVVAPGDVDERSIAEVSADDVRGYTQCHWFAGFAVWSYALRLAGWADDREVWTGSCPCPSFSSAGKGQGFDDARHLWPDWVRLIRECKPSVVFGEQADDAIGYGWLDLVQTDLEAQAYAVGKIVLGACSVGAPHIRQRLYFVADTISNGAKRAGRQELIADAGREACGMADTEYAERRPLMQHREDGRNGPDSGWTEAHSEPGACSEVRSMADTEHDGCDRPQGAETVTHCDQPGIGLPERDSTAGELGESYCAGSQPRRERGEAVGHGNPVNAAGFLGGFWRDAEWLWCRDEKYRPVEPGTFPLAHGATNRVLKLRGYGDAITAPVAAEFIKAYIG